MFSALCFSRPIVSAVVRTFFDGCVFLLFLNVDGPVAEEEPLVLRLRQDNEPAAFRPRAAVVLGAGAPQRRHANRWPWNVGVA